MVSDDSPSRRKLLALTGTAFGTAVAGCSGAADDQSPSGAAMEGTTKGETATDDAPMTSEKIVESQDTPTDGATTTPLPTDGLVTVERDASVPAVVEAISGAIEDNESLTLMTTVDHAANAKSVGRSLPPTTLLLFGNPELGTQLMNASRTVGIDLPQKFLVYETDGQTLVTYNDPQYLAARHGITGEDALLEKISGALDTLANAPTE